MKLSQRAEKRSQKTQQTKTEARQDVPSHRWHFVVGDQLADVFYPYDLSGLSASSLEVCVALHKYEVRVGINIELLHETESDRVVRPAIMTQTGKQENGPSMTNKVRNQSP